MKPIIIINTFKTVLFEKNKKPIVICDIDHTFLRPKFDYSFYYEQLKSEYSDKKELEQMALNIFNTCLSVGLIKQTDEEGFNLMLDKINSLNGKLIFLTARGSLSHDKTIKDLEKVGLKDLEQYEIHYTCNEISKGDYINKHHLLEGYNQHIFIDDYPHFLESAARIFPDMNCYLFKY